VRCKTLTQSIKHKTLPCQITETQDLAGVGKLLQKSFPVSL